METKNDFPEAGSTTELIFTSDGFRLKGVLHFPPRASSPPPVVIGSHGLLSDGDSPKQVELAHRCNQIGVAYFRFDHRGCGQSEGVFREVTSLDGRRRDLISAAEAVLVRPDIGDGLGLFGSSMGGATCLSEAETLRAGPLVVVAAPIQSSAIFRSSPGLTEPDGAPPPYDAEKLRFDISDRLPGLSNILIVHGDADDVV
ncbi:MAG: lysophospholipase, partial [Desulfobacterales bacterium]|nr:lysophospholipase [Desulfobacterales bacterium]